MDLYQTMFNVALHAKKDVCLLCMLQLDMRMSNFPVQQKSPSPCLEGLMHAHAGMGALGSASLLPVTCHYIFVMRRAQRIFAFSAWGGLFCLCRSWYR